MAVWTFKCVKCGSGKHKPLDATLNVTCAKCGTVQSCETMVRGVPSSAPAADETASVAQLPIAVR